ncbi:MAG: metalloendopeptidase glycoprotease family [Myxococcales bacterium]|nr:metalloendopeptidase glycoprotease family [Myxococcales bacterium]
MLVLGLESSCDETAAALVEDGVRVRGDAVASQVAVHREWGGVVPEIASRHHVTNLIPVLETALKESGATLADVDGLAVTRGPGLVGALLVGVQAAKAIAWARGLPLVGVNHLEGHLSAVWLDGDRGPAFPHLALLVSGGHSELVIARDHGVYELLGATRDDAAGEAFDKVGKMLGLGYPAGPVVDQLAATGDPNAVKLPRAMRGRGLDFSFSGMKTAMQTLLQRDGVPVGQALADLCASFQAAIVDQLVRKTRLALEEQGLTQLQVAGGVAANRGLRAALAELTRELGVDLFIPSPKRCTDNAAMIAAAGYWRLQRGERADLMLNATASLPLA